jgi:hypothetical protein
LAHAAVIHTTFQVGSGKIHFWLLREEEWEAKGSYDCQFNWRCSC